MTDKQWRIRFGAEAEADFVKILADTKDAFGLSQLAIYRVTLTEAFATLRAGPGVLGSIWREELRPGLRSLHVARKGRRGRHLILYRGASGDVIEVIRILHDAMDLARHIPPDLE